MKTLFFTNLLIEAKVISNQLFAITSVLVFNKYYSVMLYKKPMDVTDNTDTLSDTDTLMNTGIQLRIVRRRQKKMTIRQTFYLVDSAYAKTWPNEFYIRADSDHIYLIKYERFFK